MSAALRKSEGAVCTMGSVHCVRDRGSGFYRAGRRGVCGLSMRTAGRGSRAVMQAGKVPAVQSVAFHRARFLLDAQCEFWFLTTTATPLPRSEEHTSELQSLMRISYAVFCLKNKKQHNKIPTTRLKFLRPQHFIPTTYYN